MKGSPEERAALLAQYMIESGDTVRGAAKKFCVSKSTVHKDVTERLKKKQSRIVYTGAAGFAAQ